VNVAATAGGQQNDDNLNPLAEVRVAFLGAGVMAESMIAGLLNQGLVTPSHIIASHPRSDRRDKLQDRFDILTTEDNLDAAAGADIVTLTVKPQVLKTVMRQLNSRLRAEQLAVSVIAGATLEQLSHGLSHEAVARVMPNTPAQIGQGMSVWTTTDAVTDEQRLRAKAILGALGEELWVDEEKYVDMATALSGTGPTYVFLVMEALIDAGVHMGFPRRIAEQIVLQTVSGSVAFARDSGKHMAELRNMVTSPGVRRPKRSIRWRKAACAPSSPELSMPPTFGLSRWPAQTNSHQPDRRFHVNDSLIESPP